jgi:Mrp family chromosome partitioning ATPase
MTMARSKPVERKVEIMRAEAETGKVLQLNLADDSQVAPEFTLDPELLRQNLVLGFEAGGQEVHPFFSLRSQIWKHVQSTQHRTFAVTSVQPGDGKTHVAANLAAVLSRIHPTILVELDLRRPSLGDRLGLPSDHAGIDDYLAGSVTLAQSGIRAAGFNLTIHRVRCPSPAPEKLLASPRLLEMTKAMRAMEGNPICIIDTPPAVVQDDMMMIVPATDGILMVVQEGRTSKHVLTATISSLAPTPTIGTILNMSISNPRAIRGYEYYYNHSAA